MAKSPFIFNGKTAKNLLDGVKLKELGAAIDTPEAGSLNVYAKVGGVFHRDSAGTERQLADTSSAQTITNKSIDASQIDSGILPDARIQSSGVTQHEADINHDALTNYVANEHIDHTSVTLTAGTGLTGGGDISANRTFNLADTAVIPGPVGSNLRIPFLAVDQQGRITLAGDTPLSIENEELNDLSNVNVGTPGAGQDGQVLVWVHAANQYQLSAVGAGTLNSIGTLDSETKDGDGAVVSGPSIVLQTADDTNPGLVSVGAQTYSGVKTHLDNILFDSTKGIESSAPGSTLNVGIGSDTSTINVGTGAGATTINIGGAGDTITTATLEVTDPNIVVNADGTDASAEGAGITVDRTGTSGSLIYDSTLTSKWKLGNIGSESEVITAAGAQTIAGVKTFSSAITGTFGLSITGASGLSLSTSAGGLTVDRTGSGAEGFVEFQSEGVTKGSIFARASGGLYFTNSFSIDVGGINDAGNWELRNTTGSTLSLVKSTGAEILLSATNNTSADTLTIGNVGGEFRFRNHARTVIADAKQNGEWSMTNTSGITLTLKKPGGAAFELWADTVGTTGKILIDNNSGGTLRVLNNSGTPNFKITQAGQTEIAPDGGIGGSDSLIINTFNNSASRVGATLKTNSGLTNTANMEFKVVENTNTLAALGGRNTTVGGSAGYICLRNGAGTEFFLWMNGSTLRGSSSIGDVTGSGGTLIQAL